MERVVEMGAYVVSDQQEDVLKTYALGSCVAVTVYSSANRAAGMIHVVLPSALNARDAAKRPGYFARTGIPLLIDAMCHRYGCCKDELDIHMYGGMDSAFFHDVFNIGQNNILAAKYALLDMGLTIQKVDLRGNESRTLSMAVKTGAVEVYRQFITR